MSLNSHSNEVKSELALIEKMYINATNAIPKLDIGAEYKEIVSNNLDNFSGNSSDYLGYKSKLEQQFETRIAELRIMVGARILNVEDGLYPRLLELCESLAASNRRAPSVIARDQLAIWRTFNHVDKHACVDAFNKFKVMSDRIELIRK